MEFVQKAQKALERSDLDGWLLYDFRGSNPIFWELLGNQFMSTRRLFLYIPRSGQPRFLAQHVDANKFAALGLAVRPYSSRHDLETDLKALLRGASKVAMEYSPMAALPTLSWVDGGTLDMVRALGVEVVTSAELIQATLGSLSPDALERQRSAAQKLGRIVLEAFSLIGERLSHGVDEWTVARFIQERFGQEGLWTDEGPIVSVNENSGDPHYSPSPERSRPIRQGDWVLIDLWAKEEGGAFADITWVAYVGKEAPPEHQKVFDIVVGARGVALQFIKDAYAKGYYPQGCEVDQVARKHIQEAGYGSYFTHRLGHSLGSVVHGYGANLDSFETQDIRPLIPGSAFTIEPGIYLPSFGVRSEIDVITTERGPQVTSSIQREIVYIE